MRWCRDFGMNLAAVICIIETLIVCLCQEMRFCSLNWAGEGEGFVGVPGDQRLSERCCSLGKRRRRFNIG